jgi:hypothetical protein
MKNGKEEMNKEQEMKKERENVQHSMHKVKVRENMVF